MEQEITIVSAFFNINRDSWEGFSRTAEQYFSYFKDWAKLKNKIIVYVDTEDLKNNIIDFRESLGQKDNTIVHIVKDFREIDSELYDSINKATNNQIQKGARLYPNNPEVWNADYDFVMLLKMWCVQDAVARNETGNMVAWVDFGYNHGGAVIDKNSNFNYVWKYDFPEKITVFLIQPLDNRPIFDIVCTMDTYIMGTLIVGAAKLWNPFWNAMKKNMMSLNAVGLTDDDQNIILMCYRENPEMFNTYLSGWQLPLKQFGGDHLLLVGNKDDNSFLYKELVAIYQKIKKHSRDKALARRILMYIKTKKAH